MESDGSGKVYGIKGGWAGGSSVGRVVGLRLNLDTVGRLKMRLNCEVQRAECRVQGTDTDTEYRVRG